MRNMAVVLAALALSACATPVAWMRADGSVVQEDQRQLAMTICQGEAQKARLTETRVLIGALQDIYAGCMAQHGYVAVPVR